MTTLEQSKPADEARDSVLRSGSVSSCNDLLARPVFGLENKNENMNLKQFAIDNARTQAEPHGLVRPSGFARAGNSIEWYRCACGTESNLLWTYKSNKSRILACCLDCALKMAKGQVKLGYLVDE